MSPNFQNGNTILIETFVSQLHEDQMKGLNVRLATSLWDHGLIR